METVLPAQLLNIFQKVLADKKLGIERDARFVKPAELENEINSADIIISDTDPSPGAEGDDQGVGNEQDYNDGYTPNDTLDLSQSRWKRMIRNRRRKTPLLKQPYAKKTAIQNL